MIGTTVGSYRIVSRLGAGGMGVVYKAFDQRLQRHVALKVLPAAVSADEGRRRLFLREARAASALNDSHIITIYDILDHEGTDVLVMELVEGRTLREAIAAGPMAIPQALDWARQMAEALGVAHGAGIVHRDLKPGNVMVTDRGGDQGARLRAGQGAGHCRRGDARAGDAGGRRAGHAGVHVARAGPRQAGRSPHRHLRPRHHPVRDARRPPAVHRRESPRAAAGDRARHAAAGAVVAARGERRAGRRGEPRARAGSANALPVDVGAGLGAQVGVPWARLESFGRVGPAGAGLVGQRFSVLRLEPGIQRRTGIAARARDGCSLRGAALTCRHRRDRAALVERRRRG